MIEFYDMNELMNQEMAEFAARTAERAVALLALPAAVDICLNIVTPEEIRELNAEQREIDSVTDVLSFPMLFFESPMEKAAFSQADVSALNPETGNIFLGDIILCFAKAKEQAAEYGHSLEREVAFLIVHSLLHLVGYDHMTAEQEAEMFGRQEKMLKEMNINR